MSKINELIQTLCPDGVEYKLFGDVASICRGASPRPIKQFVTEDVNGVNWIKIGDTKVGSKYITETAERITEAGAKKSRYVHIGDFIMSNSMSFGRPYICQIEGCIHDGWLAISEFHDSYNSDFLYYLLCSTVVQKMMEKKASNGGAVSNLNADIVRALELPVPPLPVQEEIVRILDEYTELEAELEAKLSEEIELKQKQYEVYRARLLNDDSYDGYTLPEISENCDSQRKPITSSQRVSGSTPYYGASGIVDYVDDYIFDGEYLLISEDGANLLARNTPIAFSISGKTWVNNHAHILKFESYYTQKWVEYYFNSIDLSLYITGGAQPKLNQKNLNKIVIPVPSPTEQERIVKILDKYDTYTRDMISTLNTELESRKKQYAYYRDKLLTFKRKEV